MKLLVVLLVVALYECRSIEKRSELATGRRIIEKITDFDEAVAYDSNVLLGVGADTLEFLNRKYWDLSRKAADLSSALNDAKAKLAEAKEFGGEALIEAQANVMALKEVLKEFLEEEGEEAIKVIGKKAKDLSAAMTELQESMKKGAESVKNVLLNMKDSVWDSIYEYLDQYSDRKRRELKGFSDLTSAERGQWAEIIEELKQKLREKFGVQDPEEDYRVDPEVREKFKAVKKELLKVMEEKNGPIGGHEDLTDDEWRRKYQKVIDELKSKFRQKRTIELTDAEAEELAKFLRQVAAAMEIDDKEKRSMKGFYEMTPDERNQWDSLLVELRKVLAGRGGPQKRELKSFQQMSPEEREQWDSVLAELKKVLKEKFGVQDPSEGQRLSPAARLGLSQVRQELMNKYGQTGHEDLTDDEWREKYAKVIEELKAKFAGKQKRSMKGFYEMTPEERNQWDSLLVELNKVLAARGRQTRALKSYNEMSAQERIQHEDLMAELKQKLHEKFGVQDENEGLRPSMETRQKLKQVLKSIRKDQGYEDLTDDEWRVKFGRVIEELKAKLAGRQVRALKSYNEMSAEERAQHEALLAELRQKLQEKFGVQDENEGLRPSMETRQKLKQVLKSIRKDQGYEDLTDAEWREKFGRVIDELKAKFRGN